MNLTYFYQFFTFLALLTDSPVCQLKYVLNKNSVYYVLVWVQVFVSVYECDCVWIMYI